jgi:hypothetical protein
VELCHQEEIVSGFSACQRYQRPLAIRKAIIAKFPEEPNIVATAFSDGCERCVVRGWLREGTVESH